MADLDLQNIYDLLISIAHEAGRMIMGATPSQLSSGTKKNCTNYFASTCLIRLLNMLTSAAADLVTETDQAVEKMVSTRLMSAYPKFSFIGEETYVPGSTRLTSAPTFIGTSSSYIKYYLIYSKWKSKRHTASETAPKLWSALGFEILQC
jgi:myo-inositol-1(or 4)-monophosphatase